MLFDASANGAKRTIRRKVQVTEGYGLHFPGSRVQRISACGYVGEKRTNAETAASYTQIFNYVHVHTWK